MTLQTPYPPAREPHHILPQAASVTPSAPPAPHRTTWLIVTLVVVLVVALCGLVAFLLSGG